MLKDLFGTEIDVSCDNHFVNGTISLVEIGRIIRSGIRQLAIATIELCIALITKLCSFTEAFFFNFCIIKVCNVPLLIVSPFILFPVHRVGS